MELYKFYPGSLQIAFPLDYQCIVDVLAEVQTLTYNLNSSNRDFVSGFEGR